MASPFTVLRKYERVMMAAACLIAILAFVFVDPFAGRGARDQRQNPLIATTKYGKLHYGELDWMKIQKQMANMLMYQATVMGSGRGVEGFFGRVADETVVDTMLLARKATELGMYIGDDEITRFLRQQSGDRLKAENYAEILRQFNDNQRRSERPPITRATLYDILRTQLMYRRMVELFAHGMETTPVERWDEYSKLNKRVSAKVVPVMVADFLDRVNDPSDSTLTEFYEKYKDLEPEPGAPTPGFKVPAKVQLAYFKADFEQFKKEVTVSDEEVADYYEKNKAQFPYRAPSLEIDPPDVKPAATDDDADPKPSGEPGSDAPAPEKTDADKTDADKAPADKAPEEKAAEDKAPEAKGADEKPADEAPKQSAAVEGAADNQSGEDATAISQNAALCQEKTTSEKSAEDQKAAPASADDAPPADGPDISKTTPAAETTAGDPAGDPGKAEPGDSEPGPGLGGVSNPVDDKSLDEILNRAKTEPAPDVEPLENQYELPDDINKGRTPDYDPLWKVEKRIREQLTSQKALEKMKTALTGLEEKIRRYGNERNRWEARRSEKKAPAPPAPLDLAALAAEAKVTSGETPLVSIFEFSKLPGLGNSIIGNTSMLWQFAYSQGPLYTPAISDDLDGNQFLCWKTQQDAARVPELKEIRDSVVRAWKMIEARKPAREHAEMLAATAVRDKLTLAELAERDKLPSAETGLFSWLTRGAADEMFNRSPARLSTVAEVEDAGPDFMKAVFELPLQGIGVAVNNPQTIAYVVQVTTFDPPVAILRHTFLADRYDYSDVGATQRQETLFEWMKAIREEGKLKWESKPEEPSRDESEEG